MPAQGNPLANLTPKPFRLEIQPEWFVLSPAVSGFPGHSQEPPHRTEKSMPMSERTNLNKAIVRRIFQEMWNQANPAVANEIFAEPEGVVAFMTQFLRAFPDLQHVVEELLAEDDTVAARFSASDTHRGPRMGFQPTRKPITYTGVTLARIENGKIVSHHTWWDTSMSLNRSNRRQNNPPGWKEPGTCALSSPVWLNDKRQSEGGTLTFICHDFTRIYSVLQA